MKKFISLILVLLTCIQVSADKKLYYKVHYNELTMTLGQHQDIQIRFSGGGVGLGDFINYNPTAAYAYYDENNVNTNIHIYAVGKGSSVIEIWSNFNMSPEIFIYAIRVIDVAEITLPDNLCLSQGDSYTYTPIINDMGASSTLTWQSTNPEIATVSEIGTVKAMAEGKTTIICMAANGVTAQSLVEVKPLMVESITLDVSNADIAEGDQIQLVATIEPEKASKNLWWSSSNEFVAFVDENGLVTGASPGYCLISGYATDGSGKKASCVVRVKGDTSNVSSMYKKSSTNQPFYNLGGIRTDVPKRKGIYINGNNKFIK